ncbi:hypothetical protein BMWSH_p304 (plasmid) [Priestia megaterium WSH-002]|uniref:Uncharacterized protein n=1 Tax=Priestia megaterium (strain WSH-002) TaxID=1006007 RepID=A0A8D4BSM8_PRIMW|nr:hypothetical protein BMWSH_p304 [Priestia megaterium WSH-002]
MYQNDALVDALYHGDAWLLKCLLRFKVLEVITKLLKPLGE